MKKGQAVFYQSNNKPTIGLILDVFNDGDIRTDMDGVRTAGEFELASNNHVLLLREKLYWAIEIVKAEEFGDYYTLIDAVDQDGIELPEKVYDQIPIVVLWLERTYSIAELKDLLKQILID